MTKGERRERINQWADRYVTERMAWTLLMEMWQTGQIVVPGQERAWEYVGRLAEPRSAPRKATNPAAAQRLLDRHAEAGASFIEFEEPTGGIIIPLEIDEGVFNPELTKATRLLLSVVRLAEFKGKRMLDAFCGSGVMGLYAAWAGAEVVAYDTSAAAVACARKNAQTNELGGKITVRQGDVSCLEEGDQFDIIAANPPLLPETPSSDQPLSSAVFDTGLYATIEFIRALPAHLAPGGRCYLLTSSAFDQADRDLYTVCDQYALSPRLVAAAPRDYEWYRIHEIRPAYEASSFPG